MKKIPEHVAHFFRSQGFVILNTLDKNGFPHSSCKGVLRINRNGRIYILDLYSGTTYKNLNVRQRISITAVDEHKFRGYCLKGKARIITGDQIGKRIIKLWEERITSRISGRLLKNLYGQKGHPRHPELFLPAPKYVISMDVEEIVDLSPHHINQSVSNA